MSAQIRIFCFGIVLAILVLIISNYSDHITHGVNQMSEQLTNRIVGKPEPVSTNGDPAIQVLILTYMRSGSSLVGDILQHSPGAFYVYEPFRSLGHKSTESYTLEYVNGTIRKPPFDMQEEIAMNIRNWLTCDTGKLLRNSITDGFMNKGIKTKMFKICYNAESKKHSQEIALKRCSRQLKGICERSQVRIIKTIRTEVGSITHLLEELPNMKLVHLIRDPRATLFSQSKMGKCKTSKGGREGCTDTYCSRLETDILYAEQLKQQYPNKVMTVFYEDIARHPIEASRNVYKFLGTVFAKPAEQYIYNITMAGKANNCAICTTRSNSSEHIDTWKTSMQKSFIDIIQRRCIDVLKRNKYEIVNVL